MRYDAFQNSASTPNAASRSILCAARAFLVQAALLVQSQSRRVPMMLS
jgi:hypothetical protein